MEKYKRQDVTPVEKENERDESYQGSNPQIDCERTSDNYHLIYPQKEMFFSSIKFKINAKQISLIIQTVFG